RGEDSNLRPLGYEPNELPTAPPRDLITGAKVMLPATKTNKSTKKNFLIPIRIFPIIPIKRQFSDS
ncbi:hypothetical protein, partial [Millionella massiliensis]|uniref:hypothetical protein n=1 Tax=Millionella massiliensis TaxID=1871023 RepID=UPI0024B65BB6